MAVDIPIEPHCNPTECDEAIAYLLAGFGPWYDDQEKRQLRRLFLDYSPQEVQAAIDQLIKQGVSRPRASDIGAVLKANRRFLVSQKRHGEDCQCVQCVPPYTTVEPAEDTWTHQMIEAVKAGDHDRIKELEEAAP